MQLTPTKDADITVAKLKRSARMVVREYAIKQIFRQKVGDAALRPPLRHNKTPVFIQNHPYFIAGRLTYDGFDLMQYPLNAIFTVLI